MGSTNRGWTDTSLRICLQNQSSKVRHCPIDLIHLVLPEGNHSWIKRIECRQSAHCSGAAEIHCKYDLDTPGPESVRNTNNFWQELRGNYAWIRIDVVDR